MTKKPIGIKEIKNFDIFSLQESTWRKKALCFKIKGVNTSIFFASPKSNDILKAKAICTTCSVAAECLQSSLVYQYGGVWGGKTEEERSFITKVLLSNDLTNLTIKKCKDLLSINTSLK